MPVLERDAHLDQLEVLVGRASSGQGGIAILSQQHRDQQQRRGRRHLGPQLRLGRQDEDVLHYHAPTPEAIRKTAQENGLPVDRITEVRVLDPYFYR